MEDAPKAEVVDSSPSTAGAVTTAPFGAHVAARPSLVDVEAVMRSLSDLGQQIEAAQGVQVARFVPPRRDEPISSFYDVVDTARAWGQLPVPEDVAQHLKQLLQLRSVSCVHDPNMQALFQAIASTLGSSRHLLPQEQRSKLFDQLGRVGDPQVLFEYITREEVRRRDEFRQADRTLPLPVYDANHGFHESDIEAYTHDRLLSEGWGKPQLATSEDLLLDAAGGSSAARLQSVHAKGGLTWMERALEDQAPFETLGEYYPYRERMTSASGRCTAAATRAEVASYPRQGGSDRSGFVDSVKHRSVASGSRTEGVAAVLEA
jgi:hypothetical protein